MKTFITIIVMVAFLPLIIAGLLALLVLCLYVSLPA